jgi:hypothetical protein
MVKFIHFPQHKDLGDLDLKCLSTFLSQGVTWNFRHRKLPIRSKINLLSEENTDYTEYTATRHF